MDATEILDELKAYDNNTVIISGGEPALQDLTPLLHALKAQGYWVALETNGTIPLNGVLANIDYLIVSPKENFYLIKHANEVIIINSDTNSEQLLKIEHDIEASHYYLCPVETSDSKNLKETIDLLHKVNKNSIKKWQIGVPTRQHSDPE
jgi:organic radical activating enzyme